MLLPLLFPQQNVCHFCERALDRDALLCPDCEELLRLCRLERSKRALPPLMSCYAVYKHAGMARELIHLLKYTGDSALAQLLGQAMAAYARPDGAANAVLPVPMEACKRRRRGYNQAELLARTFAQCTGAPLETGLLLRTCETASQVGRSRAERLAAMRGTFTVPDVARVADRRLWLVDDVLTTGATAIACTEALRTAGARSVTLITACRA